MTSYAVFVLSDTAISLDVSEQINVNVNLCPLVVVGSMPMESTTQPVKGTFSMSKCFGFVKRLCWAETVHTVCMY